MLQEARKNIFYILTILALFLMLLSTCNDGKDKDSLLRFYQDSLKVTRAKNGQVTAQIKVLELTNKELQKVNDARLEHIKKLVNKKTQSVVSIGTTTISKGSSTTEVIFPVHDIVNSDDDSTKDCPPIYVYPTYKTGWKTEWDSGGIVATKDSIYREIKFVNKFDIVTEWHKDGLLKQKYPITKVTSLNPHTDINNVVSYKAPNPKGQKLKLGPVAIGFFLLGGATAIFLMK